MQWRRDTKKDILQSGVCQVLVHFFLTKINKHCFRVYFLNQDWAMSQLPHRSWLLNTKCVIYVDWHFNQEQTSDAVTSRAVRPRCVRGNEPHEVENCLPWPQDEHEGTSSKLKVFLNRHCSNSVRINLKSKSKLNFRRFFNISVSKNTLIFSHDKYGNNVKKKPSLHPRWILRNAGK